MKPRVRAATSAAVAESKRGGNSGPGSLHISSNSGRLPFTRDCTRANPVSVETMTALAASPSTDPAIGRPVRVPIAVEFGRTAVVGAGDQCGPWAGPAARGNRPRVRGREASNCMRPRPQQPPRSPRWLCAASNGAPATPESAGSRCRRTGSVPSPRRGSGIAKAPPLWRSPPYQVRRCRPPRLCRSSRSSRGYPHRGSRRLPPTRYCKTLRQLETDRFDEEVR